MLCRLGRVAWLLGVTAGAGSGLAACGATSNGAPSAAVGGEAAASSGAGGGGAGGSGAGGSSASGASSWAAAPSPLVASGQIDVPVKLVVGSAPLAMGAALVGANGAEYQLSLLKLFLSEPAFVDGAGNTAPAQFLSADGKPAAYGLHLLDAADPATQVLHLAATPGSYAGLKFGVGVPEACNSASSTSLVYPLNPDSDMFWTWGSQFMFVRLEGRQRQPDTAWSSLVLHVGYAPSFAHVQAAGAITVGVGVPGPSLYFDLGKVLENSGEAVPNSPHTAPDGWVPDHLETRAPFTLK
jgi:hypothetical protein